MSDQQDSDGPQALPESSRLAMPPRLSPSPDATAESAELKLSRKREREVSLEPTTPAAGADSDGAYLDRKEISSRTPSKKNRRRLDPTEEENDDAGSGSGSGSGSPPLPSVLTSPRQEMRKKVRQISRGVEDITWQSKKDKDHSPHRPSLDVQIEAEEVEDKAEGSPIDHDTEQASEPADVELQGVDEDEDGAPAAPSPKTPEQKGKGLPGGEDYKDDATMEPATPEISRLHPNGHEKGLKRKFLERGTSHGPPDAAEISGGKAAGEASEPLKRPRDDADKDDNPRETKRPTPPPSPPPSPKIAKTGGFMAYSSTSSPFASVKGKNIFGGAKAAPSPVPSATAQSSTSSLGSAFGTTSTPSSSSATGFARSGFEAFASTSSPFAAAARSSAPVLGATSQLGRSQSPASKPISTVSSNPFASYVGPSQGFAIPVSKKPRAGSPEGSARSSLERGSAATSVLSQAAPALEGGEDSAGEEDEEEESSFGAKLRAGRDDDEEGASDEENGKPMLTEQEVTTGEEDDETIHQVRGKLFSLHGSTWKERGTGLLKLNVKVEDGTGARLLMRKDATYTLLLNVTLFHGMKVSLAQDPRYIRFSAIEDGVATTYNLKVANARIAADLLEEINANIPT